MLNIPKRTLLRWGQEKANEIELVRKSTFDHLFRELNVSIAQRITMLAKDLKRINKELKERDIDSPVIVELFRIKMKLISELAKYDTSVDESVECDGEGASFVDPFDDVTDPSDIEFCHPEKEEKFLLTQEEREKERERIRQAIPGISEDMVDKIECDRICRSDLSLEKIDEEESE
jgi:hypothetical protein